MTMKARMLLSVAVVSAFFLLVMGAYSVLFVSAREQQVQTGYATLSSVLSSAIDEKTDFLHQTAIYLGYSTVAQSAMYSDTPVFRMQNLKNLKETMSNYVNFMDGVLNISMYRDYHYKATADTYALPLQESALKDMDLENLPYTSDGAFSSIKTRENGENCFVYALPCRNFQYKNSYTSSYVAVLYDLNSLVSPGAFNMGRENYLTVTDGENYYPLNYDVGELDFSSAPGDNPITIQTVGTGRQITYTFPMEPMGWQLSYTYVMQSAFPANSTYARYLTMILIGAVALIGFFLYHLNYISRSIGKVTARIGRVNTVDEGGKVHSGLPEMQALSQELNKLLMHIKHQQETNAKMQQDIYEANLAKKDAEMAFYKSQISPHFLFNTLECIRAMAQYYKVEPVQRLALLTSRMLQYSLYSSQEVTLREEVENARVYMEIMNIRSMNKYEYREKIPEELMECPVVSMMLQPVVENAVRHGSVGIKRKFVVLLRAVGDAGRLIITVTDNGRGMDESEVQRLNHIEECSGVRQKDGECEQSNCESSESIGIKNVTRRLRLKYPSSSVTVESRKGHYTKIKIEIIRQKE